ncbi:uracil-DNA glycosylase family protein [Neptuniibacter halophilus]|uniref:uracil-DNA glycosylase family protein n=1 Tax=Neptuniibacter halophilus TaxID=651666 RepID=UPI00257254C6|nr:uracil-DNA glycosylase family protein [Neptuniibacter halophilus]
MQKLLTQIRACRLCESHLPLGPNPVIQASPSARLLIIGQAPGTRVHESGVPWNDASGNRLRQWLNTDTETFYDPARVAIMPMGFCYPGKGRSGDLPPRPECAPAWHSQLLAHLPEVKLTLLIGQYAQQYYLAGTDLLKQHKTLTERVRHHTLWPAGYFLLPHPSPRNQLWLQRNRWFELETLPLLQQRIAELKLHD